MDVIQRSITAEGVELYSGEVVNADSYPNQDLLRNHGYIKPFTGKAFKCTKCKRVFTTEYVRDYHSSNDHVVIEEAQAEGNLDLIPGTNTGEPDGTASSPAAPEGSAVSPDNEAPKE